MGEESYVFKIFAAAINVCHTHANRNNIDSLFPNPDHTG
jgi:hypothetical protein